MVWCLRSAWLLAQDWEPAGCAPRPHQFEPHLYNFPISLVLNEASDTSQAMLRYEITGSYPIFYTRYYPMRTFFRHHKRKNSKTCTSGQ